MPRFPSQSPDRTGGEGTCVVCMDEDVIMAAVPCDHKDGGERGGGEGGRAAHSGRQTATTLTTRSSSSRIWDALGKAHRNPDFFRFDRHL